MSIKDLFQKIKSNWAVFKDQMWSQEKGLKIHSDLYIVAMIILVGTASYGLGKISSFEKNKTPISVLSTKEYILATVLESSPDTNNQTASNKNEQLGIIVASKSGTKYYYPWCTGVSRIKEENKVWFNSIDEARARGLTPAANCTGLK